MGLKRPGGGGALRGGGGQMSGGRPKPTDAAGVVPKDEAGPPVPRADVVGDEGGAVAAAAGVVAERGGEPGLLP